MKDAGGRQEIAFILVRRISADTIFGELASTLLSVQGVPPNATFRLLDASVLDWLVSRPDGTEEGNVLGLFMDSLYGRPLPC
jgi:hypothetical protein